MIVYDKEQKQIVIPNGIGNIDIYNNGVEAGYNQGKIDGIDEQKSKLESINITENGTYSREDGYNHIEVNVPDLNGSYDEGYNQGQAVLVANARDIEVTKNGVYQSKYSDPIMPIVTGVYADDTKFYGYAELTNKVFNTRIAGSVDSRLEFWYKGDNAVSRPAGYNIIIGAGDKNRVNCFQIRYYADKNDTLWVEIDGSDIKVYNWDDTVWHHLIVSKAEGLWIDGEKKGDFSPTTNTIKGEFYINGAAYDKFGNRPANGYFGMIKIDDFVIIPTANGFKKVNGDEMLQVVKDGNYTFAENRPTYGEGQLYKTINVNIDVDSYFNNGYNQGKTDGIREQRLKLENINITENGTYYKEDGYREVAVNVPDLNGSYDEGYAEGQADIAAKARVLEVTENGVYKSKYSDPILPTTVTGVYDNGTNFYSYAELNGKVFNTKIAATVDSRLEFWYKGDNTSTGFGDNVIIGAGDNDDNNYFQVRYYEGFNGWVKISVGNSTIDINNWNDTVWHHLIISKAEGLLIDGEKKGDFTASNAINGEFFINGIGYDTAKNANGCFGMIKINDVIIIPTADGFQNVNTGELLQVVKDGTYTFTENLPIYGEGELYKTINVNIDVDSYYNNGYNQGKTDGVNEQKAKLESISITENGTYDREDGYNHIEVNVPDLNGSYDEGYNQGHTEGYNEGKTDGINEQKGKLTQITISENGTYANENGYSEVVVNVPDLNGSYDEGYNQGKIDGANEQKSKLETINITENGTYRKEDGYNEVVVNVPGSSGNPKINVKEAGLKFAYSTFKEVPEWLDFNGVTDMSNMFKECNNLQAIPLLDTSKVTNMKSMLENCLNLQAIQQLDTSNVTNMSNMFYVFGGMQNLHSLPKFNCQKVTNMASYFSYAKMNALTDVGGWENLKCKWNDNSGLRNCPNLTYESCINVLNGLYDFTGNGETPNSNQGQLKVAQSFIDTVGDEISIGTSRGWSISA